MSDDLYNTVQSIAVRIMNTSEKQDELLKEAATLGEEIDKLSDAVVTLIELVEPESKRQQLKSAYPEIFEDYVGSSLGLTDAIRQVLMTAGRFMSPADVRDGVMKISRSLQSHKSPLSSVHTVLRRLVDSSEVTIGVIEPDGQTLYGWSADQEARAKLLTYFAKEDREKFLRRKIAPKTKAKITDGKGN